MKLLRNIQGLRAIAVLLVALVHIGLVEKKYSFHPVLPDWIAFGMSGVDIFFVISGFIMMFIAMRKQKSVSYAFTFLSLRIIRIYPIYWFYTILILLVYYINPGWVNSSSAGDIDIVKSFLLFPQISPTPFLAVGWTLIHEMYFYVGFFMLLLFVRSNKVLMMSVMFWGILVAILDFYGSYVDPVAKIVTHPLTLEFMGGAAVAYLLSVMEKSEINVLFWKIVMILALVSMLINYAVYDYVAQKDVMGWWRVLLFGMPALILIYGSILLEYHYSIVPDWMVNIGDRSYTIYLSHVLVINAVGKVWQLFSFESMWMSIVFVFILLASVLIFGKYAYEWIEAPMLQRLKKLNHYEWKKVFK